MSNDAEALLDRVDELPPLPAVAARVMSMADDDRVLERAFSFIESASGAPDRWYAGAAG